LIIKIIYNKKKRAISPVIAVILLIGLAVAAVAAIFIVVLPLMQPSSNLELTDAYMIYDSSFTKTANENIGYGKGSVFLANAGTGKIEVTEIKIYHAETSAADDWTEIRIQDGAESLQGISINDPYELSPLAVDEELSIRFPIPVANYNNSRAYKITIKADDGTEIDTSLESIVDEEDMLLAKDRPVITPPSSIGTIRRETQISSSGTPTDNSEVKNVTYDIYNSTGFKVLSKTITSSLWRWVWDTYNSSGNNEFLPNGSYSVVMTVYDYAGLYDRTGFIDFTIDNDYINPAISNVTGASSKNGQDVAEVGESFAVSATITDSGSAVSSVSAAYIYYKLNDSSIDYSSIIMDETAGNMWQGNIPAGFINSDALENNFTYYIIAIDDDENSDNSNDEEAGVLDTTKPDITQHTPVTEANYDSDTPPVITLSVTVEDKDSVDQVNLVWREDNDTGLLIPDSWQVENFVTQSGDTWTFSIPITNVTIDGIDYYINATDPSGNTNDGSASSPYHITINDQYAPSVSFNPVITSPTGSGQDVTVRVIVDDNDPSFSTERFIAETGTVRLSYKIGAGSWSTPYEMSHTVGDSSKGEDGVWEDVIKGGNFSELTTVSIRVEAIDYAGQIDTIVRDVDVSAANEPTFRYISDSVSVWGNSSHIMSFDINSLFTGDTEANAVITNITTTLAVNTKGVYIGNPQLIQIDANGTGIGGTDPRWTNKSSPSEGVSGYKAVLDNTISIDIGETMTLTLTYANSSGGFFDLNDLNVTVNLGYTYAAGTSSGYSDDTDNPIDEFSTPITVYQTITETRYMRSDQMLGATQSTGFQTLNERGDRWSGSQTVYWYIQVWVRKADTTMIPISTGNAAQVFRTADGNGLQSGTWVLASNYDLDPTDSVVIHAYMQIGGNTYGPVEFVTEQLGAEELVAGTWTVWYYTERDYDSRWNQDRTRGIFYYGDSTYNSRIVNFAYTALSGGAAPMIMSPLSSIGELPGESVNFTSDRISQTSFLIERRVKHLSSK
jgi:FlaG/FlaF family flagellin (archaellin)